MFINVLPPQPPAIVQTVRLDDCIYSPDDILQCIANSESHYRGSGRIQQDRGSGR
jgi:hypothetical protein